MPKSYVFPIPLYGEIFYVNPLKKAPNSQSFAALTDAVATLLFFITQKLSVNYQTYCSFISTSY